MIEDAVNNVVLKVPSWYRVFAKGVTSVKKSSVIAKGTIIHSLRLWFKNAFIVTPLVVVMIIICNLPKKRNIYLAHKIVFQFFLFVRESEFPYLAEQD
ncbi:MAG: hypothetical protein MUP17_09685 [candidate division Zixibacteria bacterium]|nr:hypothetical protein [candidate division Zixibacteria bacterium]